METLEKVLVEYDEMFCDEISIKLLYQHKNKIEGFVDENNNQVSKSAVADWIMENYYNDRKFMKYCKEGKGKIPETAEQLYQCNEEYRKSVDEETVNARHARVEYDESKLKMMIELGIPVAGVKLDKNRITVCEGVEVFEKVKESALQNKADMA